MSDPIPFKSAAQVMQAIRGDAAAAAEKAAATLRGAGAPVIAKPDPLAIPTETYLLDALLGHAQAVCNQIAFRGRPERAQQLAQLFAQVQLLRNILDRELTQLVVPAVSLT